MNETTKKLISVRGSSSGHIISNMVSGLNKSEIEDYIKHETRQSLIYRAQQRLNSIITEEERLEKLKLAKTLIEDGANKVSVARELKLSYVVLKQFLNGGYPKKVNRKRKEFIIDACDHIKKRLANYKWDSSLKIEQHFFDSLESTYDSN